MFRFLPTIFFPASMPWPAAGTLVGILKLCVSITQADGSASRHPLYRSRPLSWANMSSSAHLAKAPVDGVPVKEAVPLELGAVHVQDHVHDVAQVVFRWSAEVQGPAAALEPPGGEHRLDQLPAGIGQITRIRVPRPHASGVASRTECAQTHSDNNGSTRPRRQGVRGWDRRKPLPAPPVTPSDQQESTRISSSASITTWQSEKRWIHGQAR